MYFCMCFAVAGLFLLCLLPSLSKTCLYSLSVCQSEATQHRKTSLACISGGACFDRVWVNLHALICIIGSLSCLSLTSVPVYHQLNGCYYPSHTVYLTCVHISVCPSMWVAHNWILNITGAISIRYLKLFTHPHIWLMDLIIQLQFSSTQLFFMQSYSMLPLWLAVVTHLIGPHLAPPSFDQLHISTPPTAPPPRCVVACGLLYWPGGNCLPRSPPPRTTRHQTPAPLLPRPEWVPTIYTLTPNTLV